MRFASPSNASVAKQSIGPVSKLVNQSRHNHGYNRSSSIEKLLIMNN